MREFELLEHIFTTSETLPDRVVIPPGDDMGAVVFGDRQLLVTVDQVADGVHVDLATTPIEKIGRKAITRSLSDVAAMAAKPVGAVAAGTLPRDFRRDRADALFDAMRRTASVYDCPLIGGDIAMWGQPLILSVTVFAEPAGIEPVLRRGAQVGDAIYVTGQLGGSLETGHHLDFEPRIELARKLAGNPKTRPTAMIDLSDGLARDLGHLCRGAVIDAGALPIRQGVTAWQHAVGDGEDYELLFTAAPRAMPPHIDDVPLTHIGEVTDGDKLEVRLPDGSTADLAGLGWEHHS